MDTAVPVIIRHQHLQGFHHILFGRRLAPLILWKVKIQFHGKGRSFSQFTLQRYGTAHQCNKIFGDGHTQAGASWVLTHRHVFLLKWDKKAFHECAAHPYSCIAYRKTQPDPAVLFLQLPDFHTDTAPFGGKLKRIG